MKFRNIRHLEMKNCKYLTSFSGICRIIQIIFLIALNVAVLLSNLGFNCTIFVNIASGLVILGASCWLTCNVMQPKTHNVASTRWQEGLHDALSALILLVVATILLFQNLDVPIGVAVFFSLSCALCFTIQGFANFTSGRKSRIEKYLGEYQLSPQQDEVCLTDVKKPHPRTFTITSADDDDDDDDDLPLPTITVHNVDGNDKEIINGALMPNDKFSRLISGVGSTPEPSDCSGISEYLTPQETPSAQGATDDLAAAGVIVTRTAPIPYDQTAFSPTPEQSHTAPSVQEEQLINFGVAVAGTEDDKPITPL